MRIVKRVSLYKSLERFVKEPSQAMPRLSRIPYASEGPYYIPPDYELYKYGYRFTRSRRIVLIAMILGAFSGIFFEELGTTLIANELETIYPYRGKERHISWIIEKLRLFGFWLYVEVFMGSVFMDYIFLSHMTHEYGFPFYSENILRHRQYKYFMKHRDNKFDFLELGVLEVYPYRDLSLE